MKTLEPWKKFVFFSANVLLILNRSGRARTAPAWRPEGRSAAPATMKSLHGGSGRRQSR